MPATSRRADDIVAFRYADFPVDHGDLDLRGDNSAPLDVLTHLLDKSLAHPDHLAGYGTVQGDEALRDTIAAVFSMPSAHIVVTNGASEALMLLLYALADPGNTIALPKPAFPGYRQLARMMDIRAVYYDATITPPQPALVSETRAVLVCTPHNPTGLTTGRADVPDRSGTWLIWDVSHADLFEDATQGFRTGLAEHETVVFSLSKLLRLPGARVGFAVCGSPKLSARIVAAKTHLSMSTSYLSQALAREVLASAQARYEIGQRHTQMTLARDCVLAAVQQTSTFTAAVARGGTHLLLTSCSGGDAWLLLKQVGLVGLPGGLFDAGSSSVRVCTAQPLDVIDAAISRLGRL